MGNETEFKAKDKISEPDFIKIYEKHFTHLYRFIYYKTYHKETAEDIASHVFLKAFENIDNYDSAKGSVSSWLYRIARNLVIDHYRIKHKTININDVWDLAGKDNVEIDVQNKEQLESIKEILNTLPLSQRDIVIMRIWQDMPYKEIAEVLRRFKNAFMIVNQKSSLRLMSAMTAAKLFR